MQENPDSFPATAEPLARQLNVVQLLECLLFVADGPSPISQLAQALEISVRETAAALDALEAACESRGLRLQRWQDSVQLTTAPEAADYVERFLGLSHTTRLSHAAVETLAIVAYQQPVTRPQIEAVRGVNSDSVIKSLLTKGLVEEVGRSEGVGRPILYRTTPEFLQHFGLSSLSELPPFHLPEALAQALPAEAGPNGASAEAGEPVEAEEVEASALASEAEPVADAAPEPAAEPPAPAPPVAESVTAEPEPGPKPVALPEPPSPRPPLQGDWAPVELADGEAAEGLLDRAGDNSLDT